MATKPLMICPFCDDERAFTWQAAVMHVRAKHPDKLNDLKDNKATYLEKFKCDEFGNPVTARTKEGSPPEGSFQEPEPEPEISEPEPELEPEPEPEPWKSKPKPKPKEPEPEPEISEPDPEPEDDWHPLIRF